VDQASTAFAHPERPVGVLALNSRIAPVYLMPLVEAAEVAGIAGNTLLRGLGLVASDLDVPGFTVLLDEAHTVVRRALRLLNAPDLGLTLGAHTRITQRGAMALGLMGAATLGDAIALTLQFPGSAGYLMAVHEERRENLQLVIAEPVFGSEDIAPFLVDIMFAGSVRLRRQVSEANYAPSFVELMRPRPANAAAYQAHFSCPVHFGCRRNVLATELAWLAHPLPMANAMAYRLSLQLLAREPGQGADEAGSPSALGLAVERAIRRALPLAVAPADMARSLNVAERTLRRKLAQEGLSYRGLLDAARKALAMELLASARRPILEIAQQTGFSDARAFSRAFKRWTGKPPSALLAAVPALQFIADVDVEDGN